MKKTIIGISVLALIILSSCKKDYECHCETDDGDKTEEKMITKAKEDDAENECETYEAALNGGDHDEEGEDHDHDHYHCHLD